MVVKVKKLNDKAVIPFKKHDSDFCYDVVATSCEEIAPNVYRYGIGLAFQIMRELKYTPFNLSFDFRPRSSVWETGMVLANCTGTIDEDYRGEVSAIFYHLFPDMPIYKVGDRIGQIKIGATFPITFLDVDNLDNTGRGNGGFGSTGK